MLSLILSLLRRRAAFAITGIALSVGLTAAPATAAASAPTPPRITQPTTPPILGSVLGSNTVPTRVWVTISDFATLYRRAGTHQVTQVLVRPDYCHTVVVQVQTHDASKAKWKATVRGRGRHLLRGSKAHPLSHVIAGKDWLVLQCLSPHTRDYRERIR